VDRTAAGKIVAGEVEEPAIGVPSPVGDGIVDDGRPEEHENNSGEDTTSVCHSTNGKSRSVNVSMMAINH
jgi:hypothetical protein